MPAGAGAQWSGARLPTEFEWEAAAPDAIAGTFAEDGRLRPTRATGEGLSQIWGGAWEWTASAFHPYPGFRAPRGGGGASTTASSWSTRWCCAAARR